MATRSKATLAFVLAATFLGCAFAEDSCPNRDCEASGDSNILLQSFASKKVLAPPQAAITGQNEDLMEMPQELHGGERADVESGFCESDYGAQTARKPRKIKAILLKPGAECNNKPANEENMNNKHTLDECMDAVHQKGGSHFIYGKEGKLGKAGRCYMENSASFCPEGWEEDDYDFYGIEAGRPLILKSGHECGNDNEENMQKQVSLVACMKKVQEAGGSHFIYGTGGKTGHCWWEKSASFCPEDWEVDDYDFYGIEGVDSSHRVCPASLPFCRGYTSSTWGTCWPGDQPMNRAATGAMAVVPALSRMPPPDR